MYELIFDKVILDQLRQAGKNKQVRDILSKLLNKIEEKGPKAGKIIDSKLFMYEVKNKKPPIRLYFKHIKNLNKIYIFEYEFKTSEKKQNKTIFRLKEKLKQLFRLKS